MKGGWKARVLTGVKRGLCQGGSLAYVHAPRWCRYGKKSRTDPSSLGFFPTTPLFAPHLATGQRLQGPAQLLILDAALRLDLAQCQRVGPVEQHEHHRLEQAHTELLHTSAGGRGGQRGDAPGERGSMLGQAPRKLKYFNCLEERRRGGGEGGGRWQGQRGCRHSPPPHPPHFGNCALSTHVPSDECHTSRRPLYLRR